MIIDCIGLERAVVHTRDLLKKEDFSITMGKYPCDPDEALRLAVDMLDERAFVVIAGKPGSYRVLGYSHFEGLARSPAHQDYASL